MKQEGKALLLVDLCARIPYGVKVHIKGEYKTPRTIFNIHIEDKTVGYFKGLHYNEELVENIKTYLRSMSSMKNEEKEYFRQNSARIKVLVDAEKSVVKEYYGLTVHLIDWLNSHHLDYRGLIQRGLALEAPKEMYNIDDLVKL